VFSCIYDEVAEREKSLFVLAEIMQKNEYVLKQYKIDTYLTQYMKSITPITNKASESFTQFLINKCDRTKTDVDNFIPTPFQNIWIIISFVFSTIITVTLSMITLNP
jgi:hypothetical protein